jgi:hypothetical protein
MKTSPFRAWMKDLNILKIFFLSMAATLLSSSNEGFMGLVEKHPEYSKLFILFFNEGSPFNNFKISGPEKNIWGWFSVPPYCPPNEKCSFESMVGTMKRFEKVTLDLFKAGRKSELS